jgi:hypothetical protein
MNPQMKPHTELESLYEAMRQDADGQPALNNGATIFGAYLVALAVTGRGLLPRDLRRQARVLIHECLFIRGGERGALRGAHRARLERNGALMLTLCAV